MSRNFLSKGMLIFPCLASPGQWDRPPVATTATLFSHPARFLPRNCPKAKHRFGVGIGVRQGVDDDGYHGNSHVGIEKMQRQHGGVVEEEFVGERRIKTAIETGSE